MLKMALPIVISMLVQALYNTVDSIFVARVNENALTAVSMCFPIQTVYIAIATGTGVGINSIVSKRLGEREFDEANKAARHGIFLALCSFVVLALLSFVIVRPILAIQVGDADAEILNYGIEYMSIVSLVSIGMFTGINFERLLNSTGKTHLTMISQISGAVFNIIFDPILIFGYLGFPAMGVAGAAIATVGGQILGSVIGLILNIKKNKELDLNMKGFKPDGRLILEIYRIGIPSIILQCIGSVASTLMNMLLVSYSSTAVAVLGVQFKLNSFFFFPIFALNNALVPVVAFNYGARHRKRINSAVKTGVAFATIIMVAGALIFIFLPDFLLGLFNASEDMMEMGRTALFITAFHFPLVGYNIILSSSMQAVGDSIYGMINSFMRQIIVLLPAAYLLSHFFGLDAIWWAYPIAEAVSMLLMTFFFVRVYRKKFAPLPD